MTKKISILILVFLTLFSTSALAQNNELDEPNGDATLSAKERLEERSNPPKAYFGTLTDLTDTTYEIRSRTGEIQLISYSKETTYVRVGSSEKEVDSEDAAIGDYMVAMGYVNDKQVLEAKRIILTDSIELDTREANYGKIDNITSGQITITTHSGTVQTIKVNKNTTYTSFEDGKLTTIKSTLLDEGAEVIVVTLKDDTDIIGRNIHLIPTNQE